MFLFLLIILFIVLYFLLRDYNPYQFIMIFGKKGSGKTSYISKLALQYVKKGYKVYTNCNIKGTYEYDCKNIGLNTFEPDSIVFIDEIGLVWNNREYKSFQKCVREWFKYQRQYKIKIYAFSQAFDIDKTLRDLTDKIYLITRIGKVSLLRPVIKKIGIAKDHDGNGQLVDCYQYGSIFNWKFIFLPRYYGLFKSFNPPKLDLINSTYIQYDDISRIYQDNKRFLLYHFNLLKDNIKVFVNEKITKIFHKN